MRLKHTLLNCSSICAARRLLSLPGFDSVFAAGRLAQWQSGSFTQRFAHLGTKWNYLPIPRFSRLGQVEPNETTYPPIFPPAVTIRGDDNGSETNRRRDLAITCHFLKQATVPADYFLLFYRSARASSSRGAD